LLGSSQISIVTPASVSTAGLVVNCISPCGVSPWTANTFVNAPPAAPGNNFVAIATLGGNMGNIANGASVTLFTFTLTGGCDENVRLFINGTDPNSGQMPGGQDFSNTLVNGLTAFEFYNGTNFEDVNCLPLPLDLLLFAARYDGKNVLLHWETSNEKDMQYFDIQRSVDGVQFESIGLVRATNLPENTYGWPDERIPADVRKLFYRLEQFDANGASTYSPVRQVALPGGLFRLAVSPVPASTRMTLAIGSPEETTASVEVSDATLRVVYSRRHDLLNGENNISIDVTNWPSGTYLVTVRSKNHHAEERVVVQR